MLQQFSQAQLLALLLPLCRARAERFNFSEEAAEILGLMETASHGAPLPEIVSPRELRNLRKTLARMNFGGLMGLLILQSQSRPGTDIAVILVEAFEALRQKVIL